MYALTSELHVLGRPDKEESWIAYFPVESLVLEVNAAGHRWLEMLQAGVIEQAEGEAEAFLNELVRAGVVNGKPALTPARKEQLFPQPSRIVLIPSHRCNLRCLYCYRDANAQGAMMSLDVAKDAVDLAVSNATRAPGRRVEIGFHGGGEPTLAWDVLVASVEYARKASLAAGVTLSTWLCTNGALSLDRVDWLCAHIDGLLVSVDGPPEIQDRQRPMADGSASFPRVSATLDRMAELGHRATLRVTATEATGGSLARAIGFLAERFQPKSIQVEPLYSCGRCSSTGCQPPAVQSFLADLTQAQECGRKLGCAVLCSGARLRFLDTRFCGAAGSNFFVTADGDVTACLEVTDRADPRAEFFIYGRHRAGQGFVIDPRRYARLCAQQVQSFEVCSDCFARWHCGGDCLAKSPDLSRISLQRNEYRCTIIRHLTRDQLVSEIQRAAVSPRTEAT